MLYPAVCRFPRRPASISLAEEPAVCIWPHPAACQGARRTLRKTRASILRTPRIFKARAHRKSAALRTTAREEQACTLRCLGAATLTVVLRRLSALRATQIRAATDVTAPMARGEVLCSGYQQISESGPGPEPISETACSEWSLDLAASHRSFSSSA
ncbi:hypothetical protein VTK56DRAFT_4725 [Thermocarpiscus australiensis]